MRKKALTNITIFDLEDLPCKLEYGFSIYKDVLVIWNEDIDLRALRFIDEMPDNIRENLAVVHTSENLDRDPFCNDVTDPIAIHALYLLWGNNLSDDDKFRVGDYWMDEQKEVWRILMSRSLDGEMESKSPSRCQFFKSPFS